MGKYSASHVDAKGPGDARPTALQIVEDEGLEGKLVGKIIVITGATSGIGLETARALSATGATLLLTARDLKKAEDALVGVLEPGRVTLVELDQTSFASIRKGAQEILAQTKNRINILIENAGVMGMPERLLTEDGHEMHFAVNHLSHFLLFDLLKEALVNASTPDFASRVVVVSSAGHRVDKLFESDNYNFQKTEYNFHRAYANSKLANVYMANEIERRYGSKGVHAISVHPGGIVTNIGRHMEPAVFDGLIKSFSQKYALKSTEQGAATTIVAAIGKEWEGKGGKYLEDCEEAKQGADDGSVFTPGFVEHTYNEKEEDRLWRDTLKILGIEQS